MTFRRLLVCAFAIALAAAAGAQHRLSDDELIRHSDAIVLATATGAAVLTIGGNPSTQFRLTVDEILKGDAIDRCQIDVEEIGGTAGNRTLTVPGAVELLTGRRYLLFLTKTGGSWRVLGRGAGAFPLEGHGFASQSEPARVRDTARFLSYIRAVVNGHDGGTYETSRSRWQLEADAVPSRYTTTSTRTSGEGDVHPIRWQTFGEELVFSYRSSQPDAPNGGLDALQNAIDAWSNDSASHIPAKVGTSTSRSAVQDGVCTVQFNDPDEIIPGSYSKPSVAATSGTVGTTGRRGHTALFLGASAANGVLIAGGSAGTSVLNTAWVYKPATKTFQAANNMIAARGDFTPVLLDDGTVLIAGGRGTSSILQSAELFDPLYATFSDTGSTMPARAEYIAALTGPFIARHVILAGGTDGTNSLDTAVAYDPQSVTFSTVTARMKAKRAGAASAILSDGTSILIAGGRDGTTVLSSAEIYAAGSSLIDGTFTATTGAMNVARSGATATRLTDGSILVIGGIGADGASLDSAERYDPATGRFTLVGAMSRPRSGHTATLLANGRVLVAGGTDGSSATDSLEIYDPDTRSFVVLPMSMTSRRAQHTATLLADGKVLLTAGTSGTSDLTSADLFTSPISFDLAIVKLWSDNTAYQFGGVTFYRVTEADVVVQNGLTGPGLSNGGLDQLLTNAVGQALAFAPTFSPAVLNLSYDFDSPTYGSTLQAYDAEAASYVYPSCPTIAVQPGSVAVRSGTSTTLSVSASGGGDLTYAWFEVTAGGNLPVGTNSASFQTPAITAQRRYFVRITNDCGTIDSGVATVSVSVAGDVNGDGSVTAADLSSLASYFYGSGSAPTGDADSNGDGEATALDVFHLANAIHGGA